MPPCQPPRDPSPQPASPPRRQKYGELAADKLMEEARGTNLVFYEAVVAAIKTILMQQQLGSEAANGTSSSPSPTETTTSGIGSV